MDIVACCMLVVWYSRVGGTLGVWSDICAGTFGNGM